MLRLITRSALAFALFAAALRAREVAIPLSPEANARISLNSISDCWDGHGWLPVAIRVENFSDSARSWDFEFEARTAWRRDRRMNTRATVRVEPRGSVQTVVYVSGLGRMPDIDHTVQLSVTTNGPGASSTPMAGFTNGSNLQFAQIAVSPRTEIDVRRVFSGTAAGTGSTYRHGGINVDVQSVDPARWPADWRVWSSFSDLSLSRAEHEALDGARRNALREWVAQGGTLWLIDEARVASGEPAETRIGFGRIKRRVDQLKTLLTTSETAQRRLAPWMSVAQLVTAEDRADWAIAQPITSLVVFLLFFGLLVGPVNVFLFAPATKRHRLFLTVPAISLAGSVVLGAVIVVQDGFGGAGVRRALVVLLPEENKAVVYQQQVARTGLLMSGGFTLPADTLLSWSGEQKPPESRGDAPSFRAGEAVSGAWFSSRAQLSHDLRRITPTRARVELVEGGAGGRAPVVLSSVTTTLRDFRYVDAEGKVWTADELPTGARVTLAAVSNTDAGDKRGQLRALGGATDLAPLVTHTSIRWKDDRVIFTGRLESARQP